jgi:BirA family biotin operon repressor/biotin-[acetyl-CoA-carboxylase] ligase
VLSQAFSIAALSFLKLFLDDVTVKWPNDLYVSGKKIGGILIETGILGSRIEHAVLGIGINVNQLKFPDDLPNPVSIKQITGVRYNLVEMEDLFIQTFINSYAYIEASCFDRINDLYISNLYRLGQPTQFSSGEKDFIATITGTDEFGQLKLKMQNGTEVTFGYQEVRFVI